VEGHERSLTQIKYNREGDLLFSCSKDHIINVWFSHNGERLGTFNGHNGTVWTVDVDCTRSSIRSCLQLIPIAESRFLVSGAADNSMKLWSVRDGTLLFTWEFPTAVKRVAFSQDDSQIVCITEQRMGHQGAVRVFDIVRTGDGTKRKCSISPAATLIVVVVENPDPYSEFNPIGSKATVCTFAHDKSLILTGHESGKIALFDVATGDEINNNEKAHMDVVTDLQLSPDRSYFITSSKDKTARVSPHFASLSPNLVMIRHSVA
jgi:translation initiation factor 3 subunit I